MLAILTMTALVAVAAVIAVALLSLANRNRVLSERLEVLARREGETIQTLRLVRDTTHDPDARALVEAVLDRVAYDRKELS